MSQGLLPTNWYTATITQAYLKDVSGFSNLILCFTVDRGEYCYRNLLRNYPLNDAGIEKLQNDFSSLEYIVSTKYEKEYFTEQFTNSDIRVKAKVERLLDNEQQVLRNIITEFKIPIKSPDYNVKKPKSEDHYHENNQGKKLSVNKTPIE